MWLILLESKTMKKVKKYISSDAIETAIRLFKKHHGMMKTKEAIENGISPRVLYHMHDDGILNKISRGLFHLAERSSISNLDLVAAIKKVPKGIVCLISALDFHGLTTQIPHFVDLAYCQGWREPKTEYPPIKIFRYSNKSYNLGVEHHIIDGVQIAIYSPEKTIVDCFKFRNKIGLNVAIEALKKYWFRKNKAPNVNKIMEYAKICRVEKIMRPYLESLINE